MTQSTTLSKEARCIRDFFFIVDKSGNKVPFVPNAAQTTYDANRTNRDIILKARQEGFSSFIDALITFECLYRDNLRCVLIAHDRLSTQVLFDRVKFYVENLRHNLRPDFGRSSRREIYFRKTNSTFYIGTAGHEEFGRGDCIHRLHCSEVASWPNPVELISGLFQAVPAEGTIWIESTAKGRGNWYHATCMKAMEGRGDFKLHFFPWFADPSYRRDPRIKAKDLSPEERDLKAEFNLTMAQMQWRRDKIDEMDNSEMLFGANLFPQEYPATPEEAFLASGMSVFGTIPQYDKPVVEQDRFTTLYEIPSPSTQYCIGADVGTGVGANRSVAWILNCDTMEQAGEWVSDCVDPGEFGDYLCQLGRHFNEAFIVPELNNPGYATVEVLRRRYPISRILQRYQYDKRSISDARLDKVGFLTSERTKEVAITNLRRALNQGLKVYSSATRSEMSTFIQNDNSAMCAQPGCYDDRVIAAALAVTGYRHLYQPRLEVVKKEPNPFSFAEQRKRAIQGFIEEFGASPDEYYERRDSGLLY